MSRHARTESELSIRTFLKVFAVRRALWRCLLEATLQSAAVERMWLDLRRAFTDRSAARLRVLQEQGQIRTIDPELAANALGSMVEWFAFTHFVFGEPEAGPRSLDRATAVLHDLWEHAVFGVLPEETASTHRRARRELQDRVAGWFLAQSGAPDRPCDPLHLSFPNLALPAHRPARSQPR